MVERVVSRSLGFCEQDKCTTISGICNISNFLVSTAASFETAAATSATIVATKCGLPYLVRYQQGDIDMINNTTINIKHTY